MALGGQQPATPNASLVECHGHSLTNGYGLADLSSRTSSKLAGMAGSAEELNRSINATYAASPDNISAGGYAWVYQSVRRYRTRAPYTPGSNIVVLQYGLNDMIFAGVTLGNAPTTQGRNLYKNAMRGIISRFRASAIFEDTHSSVTYPVGTWVSTNNPAQVGGRRGTGALSSGTGYRLITTTPNTGRVDIRIPGDYPGSAVCPLHVAYLTFPATTTATITSGGTGIAVKTLTLDAATAADTVNTRHCTHVLRFTGSDIPAGNGTPRTLTLTVSNYTGTGGVAFDFWGIEAEQPPIICCLNISKSNPRVSGHAVIGLSDLTNWNADQQSVVDEFRGAGGSGGSDYNTMVVDVDAAMGGNHVNYESLISTINAGATTLTVASTTGSPAAPGVIHVEDEYMTYTGKTGTTFTGLGRGAYGTVDKTHTAAANMAARDVNVAAIPNFWIDGLHWSERGQEIGSNQVWGAIRSLLPDVAKNSPRVGPGRVDARVSAGTVAYAQLVKNTGTQGSATLLKFNAQEYDTSSMHDPTGFSVVDSSFVVASDGVYMISASAQWDVGKSVVSGVAVPITTGSRALVLFKNGVIETANYSSFDNVNLLQALNSAVTWTAEYRVGDVITLGALQNGGGFDTSINPTVNSALSSAGTTGVSITTTTNTGFYVVGDMVRIDDEHFEITAIPNSTTLTVTRARQGSTAVAHSVAAKINTGINIVSNVSSPRMIITRLKSI